MTDVTPHGQPRDLARDDELLDALGHGDRPVEDDELALMLAAWRDDVVDPGGHERVRRPLRAVVPASDPEMPASRSARPAIAVPSIRGRRRPSRKARLAVAAAAAIAIAVGGTAAAAANTGPGSPLWPITKVLYPQRADRLAAEDSLSQARQAISQGRLDDARRQLNDAESLISQVDDPGERGRLQSELEDLRHLLSSATGVVSPGKGTGTPNGSPKPAPTGTPGSTNDPQLPNPLPPSGLPTLLPSPLLPTSLLPTLPLPPLPGVGG